MRDFMDFPDESLSIHPCDVNDHIEGSFNLFCDPVSISVDVAT